MEKSFSSKIGVLLAAAGSAVAMAKTVKLERITDGEMEGMITLEEARTDNRWRNGGYDYP